MNKEIWRQVKGYEGLYEVSNQGNVRACQKIRDYDGAILKEKMLKGGMFSNGYKFVTLRKNSRNKNHLVHRLVAIAFISNDDLENKKIVNHIDGNKLNNAVENLEWQTSSYNTFHANVTGLRKTNVKIEDVEKIKELYSQGKSQQKIADIFGVSQRTISLIIRGGIRRIDESRK